MSMHLVGPYLSTTGKRRGKAKFRNAEQARRARELAADWQDLKARHGVTPVQRVPSHNAGGGVYRSPQILRRDANDPRIASHPMTMDPCTKGDAKVYTGDKIIGIGTLHKSNAVPVFSDEEARDISRMRRG